MTLEFLKNVHIPINVYNKPNNKEVASRGIQLYNDSVNLYDALQLVTSTASPTDLTHTLSASTITIESSTGSDTTLAGATTTLAGVMTATDKVALNSLITLSGVPSASLHLGTFTGSIIPDNVTIKAALQALETQVGMIPLITTGNLTSASLPITVTGGTNSVVGSGVTLTFDESQLNLANIGGSLDVSQIAVSGASNGDFLVYNSVSGEWEPFTYTPPTQVHNNLSGLQGGASSQYYHLPLTVYTKLVTPTSSTLLGRSATAGEIQYITTSASLEMVGTNIALVNDLASPGNTKYYGTNGSGVKGWYDTAALSSVTEVSVTDSSDINFTVTDPTTTPDITGELTATGVTPATYGAADTIGSFTVDNKGRLTSASSIPISITSSSVSNFNEAVDDRVSALLVAGSGITLTYNDPSNTLTIAASATPTGVTNRVAWWLNNTTLTTDDDLQFDGNYLTVGNPTTTSISRISSRGTGAGLSTYGYVHLNSTNTEVFKVADNGALTIGALGDVYIHPDQTNISAGGTYIISKSGGDLGLYSDTTVYAESGDTATNTPSFKSIATRSTSIGNVLNAEIKGTFNTASGSNRYTDLYIDTQVNQTGGTSPIRSIYINPTLTSATNYAGIEVNAPGHHAIRTTAGYVRFDLGSDATGDIYYRDASGNLARLPIGTSSQVLGSTGTVPAWTTTSGSLPGGSAGDFLIYSGGNWTAASQLKEKQSGITGTNMTLASPPLASTPIYIYKNGVLQDDPDDYSISGTTVTFVNALVSADKIISIYFI